MPRTVRLALPPAQTLVPALLALLVSGAALGVIREGPASADVALYRRALAAPVTEVPAIAEAIVDPIVRDAAVMAVAGRPQVLIDPGTAHRLCALVSPHARTKCERVANSPHLRR